jgi:hypothetical protein
MKRTLDYGSLWLLQQVIADFEPFIGCRFCIAGGAVRDQMSGYKPRDIDIFILGNPLIGWLDEMFERLPDDGAGPYHALFCRSYRWNDRTVQVIQKMGLTSVPKLLNSFDWCCCLWAVTDRFELVQHSKAELVKPGGVLRIHNPNTPEASLKRGRRFAERYGMTIEPESLATLEAAIERTRLARERAAERTALKRAA